MQKRPAQKPAVMAGPTTIFLFALIMVATCLLLSGCQDAAPATLSPTVGVTPETALPQEAAPEGVTPESSLPQEAAPGSVLLEQRCTECHSAAKVTGASKTGEQWERTVTRMIGKGAQLTDAEKTILIEYLAKTYAP